MTAFKYYLGLDMGTNSVGWAATDPEYRLLKAKGKDLWGIREFNEASGAVERRTHRISRRRRQREQVRIGILKDYFHDAICEVDPSFFRRLENSKYHEEDKDVEVRYKNNIFNDGNYTDKDYFNEYPTIYHLRNELISSTEKHDVRLVFLALLNMFKHRGHFLNAGLGENNGESNIDNAYFELTELLSELTEYHLSQDIDCKQIEAILSRRDMSRTHKAEELAGVLHVDLKNKPYKELIRGLCGLKFNACVVFPDVQSEEVTKLDICLSESSFDEKSDEIANIIGEDYFEIIMAMKEMFDIGSLASIMKGHNYLSQARVASYTKHKEDLKLLKEVIKKYCGKKEYDKFFNSDADGSYASYVGSYNSKNKERRVGNKRTSEELYKEIKKLLKDAPKEDENVQKILTSIENETFLPKQLTASNGVIPNQVHAREMKKILSNAENYLPFLTEKDETGLSVSERILKLFTFQIPYYVGPTSENSGKNGGNGWVVRREDGQVLPWNIDEKIDMKATSEAFISRMVRRCTYISGEQVLPKASLEYQSYCVLNEINNISLYNYKECLAEYQNTMLKTLSEIEAEDLNEYYFSAPVRRIIWQTILVIKELVKVLGCEPERIFVEMTRKPDEHKTRTSSRRNKFEELYKKVKDEATDWMQVIAKAEEDGKIRSKKMYLYLTQKGRCMYTGKHIELDDLFDKNLYDIDHIYPRHFVKDDNIDNNLVLVCKEKNAHKSDHYPIEEEIFLSQKKMWLELRKSGFITEEKYNRLMGR